MKQLSSLLLYVCVGVEKKYIYTYIYIKGKGRGDKCHFLDVLSTLSSNFLDIVMNHFI